MPDFYTLSLHDALPISADLVPRDRHRVKAARGEVERDLAERLDRVGVHGHPVAVRGRDDLLDRLEDRKSTRLNSSHVKITYALFCLKKKTEVHEHSVTEQADIERDQKLSG